MRKKKSHIRQMSHIIITVNWCLLYVFVTIMVIKYVIQSHAFKKLDLG